MQAPAFQRVIAGLAPGMTRGLGSFAVRLAAALALALAAAACGPSPREAALLLGDIASGPGASTFKDETPAPTRREIRWGEGGVADLYMPGDGDALARVVFIPGLSELGKDDWRLVPMAESLARARFAVLVPDIANIRALRVSPADADEIGAAARWLSQQTISGRGPQRVGIVGASYAAGPGLLAATDPRFADSVAFLFTIGAYYDVHAAIVYAVTGKYRESEDGPWLSGDPTAFARWSFVKANAPRVPDPRDQVTLAAIGGRKLADPSADVSDLVPLLGPDGRTVYALFTESDPERAQALLLQLPPAVRADIDGLNLRGRDLSAFRGEAILIHGADDPAVPAVQSRLLAEALGDRAALHTAGALNHAEFKGAPSIGDQITLWRAAYRLLSIRDALAEEAAPGS